VKVLVTGATAPLGLALVRGLLADPSVERVLACGLEPRPAAFADDPRLDYHAIDLTRARSVRELVHGPGRALGLDAVVHGALHRCARDRGRRIHAQNVEITRQLLLACEGQPAIQRFVYSSAAEVYEIEATEPNLLDENAPLDYRPDRPQWLRDRVEADQLVCARMGTSRLSIVVLRCAEILAPGTGSQLFDYLGSRVCLRPLGYDPMINVLSIEDYVHAVRLALAVPGPGIYNVPGADTLPLSEIIALAGRADVPVPGPLLSPLYRLRSRIVGFDFRYDLERRHLHFGGVLDGRRARERLGYRPGTPTAITARRRPADRAAPRRARRSPARRRRRGRG
jgi:UDP-glucose 4-epimerase